MVGQRIINNILGNKPKTDRKSRNNEENTNFYKYEKILHLKMNHNKKYSDTYLKYIFQDMVDNGLFTHKELEEHFDLVYK